jgi:hypothetical protein
LISPIEKAVFFNVSYDVKIAPWTRVGSNFSLAGYSYLCSIVYSGRNGDLTPDGLSHKPTSLAILAWSIDHLPTSSAGGASSDIYHGSQKSLPGLADFPGSMACWALCRSGTWFSAASVALGTGFKPAVFDFFLDSEGSFLEL